MILSIFVFVVILVLSIPSAVIFIPLTVITRNVGPLYTVVCLIVRVGYFVGGMRFRIEGRENIPAGRACIFMANHVSNLDPPALISRIPGRSSGFSKRAVFNMPIFGYCLKLGEFIPVDRLGTAAGAQQSVATAKRILDKGLHITTFVEGQRSPDARLLPFKKGPFYLAKDSGALCIPVSIFGTEQILPRGSKRIYPGTAHIVFHPPLDPANYTTRDDLSEAVRSAIASALPEWMRG